MKNDFTPYEQAVALKQLGFDEPCFGYYEPNGNFDYIEKDIIKDFPYLAKNSEWQDLVASPTLSQAFRWFREKFGYYANLFVDDDKTFGFMISSFVEEGVLEKPIQRNYSSYEEAELACLIKLIEIK